MTDKLDMGSGSKGLKYGMAGAIAVAFGVGAMMLSGGSETPDKAPAQQRQAAATPNANDPLAQAAAAADPVAAAAAGPSADPALNPAAQPAADAMAAPAGAPAETQAAAAPPSPEQTALAAAPAESAPAKAATAAPAPATAEPTTQPELAEVETEASAAESTETSKAEGPEDAPVAKVIKPAPPAIDALRQWWGPSEASAFKIEFVGQAENQTAMVILFSSEIADPAALNQHVRIFGPRGKPVEGQWQKGDNARVAVQENLQPGRYTVVIDRQLADAYGKSLGTQLHGPVYIQALSTQQASSSRTDEPTG